MKIGGVENFSICIATPSLRSMMSSSYVRSISELQAKCYSRGFGFDIKIVNGVSPIDHTRNLLVSIFLNQTNCSHLLFVDDDMGFSVDELIAMFEQVNDADVVGVICPKRKIDWHRIKKIVLANPDINPAHLANLGGSYEGMFSVPNNAATVSVGRQLIPVDAVGTGLMLVSRSCFERLRRVAKLTSYYMNEYDGLRCESYFQSRPGLGEDFAFCNLVLRHGGTVRGATNVTVTHAGLHDYIGDLPGIAKYERPA
ncbi:hypothetical protein [Paraburkholderia sp.]|uniref:hypothetical protein n=1 Tax=Paraburkholderia sp. TaxID=1926495 RepID=UPI0025DBC552|nr:hypothetical protein [Paraburkholderia sp.]